LKGVARGFMGHFLRRKFAQLFINERQECSAALGSPRSMAEYA
jgi:hypothetical protein